MLHQLSTVVTGGILAVALLLSAPTTTALSLGGNSENLQPPQEQQHPLITEIDALDASIESIVTLLSSSAIPEDDAILSKAAKLVRRIRSLVYATEPAYLNGQEQRVADRQNARHVAGRREKYARVRRHERAMLRTEERRLVREKEERKMLRLGGGGGDGGAGLAEAQEEHEAAMLREEELRMEVEHPRDLEEEESARDLEEESYEDRLERSLWHEVIEFPECEEMLLADCVNEIESQLVSLGREINEWVFHDKRNPDGDGYNKVVIITDMTASVVKGQRDDGHVTYPFLWDNKIMGYKHEIGLNGEFDCHLKTPQECCSSIQESLRTCPDGNGNLVDCQDTKGNLIECHIFVPWGGVGNKKHDDRVIINVSPDGRVHEPPQIA